MPKPRSSRKAARKTSPLATVLRELVVPAFEQEADPGNDAPAFDLIEPDLDSMEGPAIRGIFRDKHPVNVCAVPIDDERTTLRFSMLAGYLLSDCPSDAILVGNLLEATPFHIRADCQLGLFGRLTIGCDLVVRADDAPLVSRRFGELRQLAEDLDWFFPLRLPHHLDWQDTGEFEIDWNELPHYDLGTFIDQGMEAPPDERTPLTLLRLAQGMSRWQVVLKLLREHPEELPRRKWAPLKCLALCQLRRWLPAIRAAKEGGIRNGRYPGEKWLSPSYLLALIEGGDDIEALRLLAKPVDEEPGFYHWMRGLALHHAGDREQALVAFSHYLSAWPGDVLGGAASQELIADRD